jgi:hypothetical protein
MDRDTQATLHRRKAGNVDRVTTAGPLGDLVRQFKSLPESIKPEYSIMVDGIEYGPQEIKGLAAELGL